MRIRPLQGQVLVEVLPRDEKDGEIYLPDQAKGTHTKAIVREIGPWAQNKKGHLIPYDFRKGEKVIISNYSGVQVNRDIGEKFKLVTYDKILAVIG